MTAATKKTAFGVGTGRRSSRRRDNVLLRARAVGIAGDVEAMQLALGACIGVYDQILATVPPHIRPLVQGCGEGAMKTAREILEAV